MCHARARLSAFVVAVGVLLLGASIGVAAELDVRIRFAWGSGGQSPQRWHGKITVAGAELSDLQPLGIEADEAAALQLIGNEIRVAPLVRRAFDGCDVTVRGDEAATVRVELQYSPEAAAKVIEVPLGQVASEQFRTALDDLGGDLLVHRTPGDRLRVTLDREHLVFAPGEAIALQLAADLEAEAAESQLTIQATLHRADAADAIEKVAKPYEPYAAATSMFQFTAPGEEGAYVVKFAVRRPVGLTDRLAPWEKNDLVASREIEFVVVDPKARLPRLTGGWELVSTIDPASTPWWRRVPQWTQFDKLPGFSTPRPLGNVRPTAVADSPFAMVELPARTPASDPSTPTSVEPGWQAYLLPVGRVGEPHAVEIELPRGVRQHLGVNIVEPDAAGRVTSFGRDCGVYGDEASVDSGAGVEIHRIVFWPSTKSPALVLTNRSGSRAVQYGKIRLLRHATVTGPSVADEPTTDEGAGRLVAAYIGTPRFADTFGGAEQLDPASKLSVDGWNTFLTGANRLAQHLRAAGYNGAIISVAGDGASLAPIESLGASPRFDTGLLSTAGADPRRKDVLEVLLRVFDREGLKLIPAVQLAAPLPRLEALAAGGDADIRCRGRDGRPWREHFPQESATAPHYNILHEDVQRELASIADELLARYSSHPSFAGLAVQLNGNGYGVLPGLTWGMDDATTAKFAADLKIELPGGDDPNRFQQRAALLLGKHLASWKDWRAAQLTQFYAALAQRVARDGRDWQLVLCTEDLLSGPVANERLRQTLSGRTSLEDAFDEIGVDPRQLAAAPNVTLLRPRRLLAGASVDGAALDQRINTATELDQAVASQPQAGELLFQTSSRLRLPSFDAQSPFGADRTYFSVMSPSVPAGDAAREGLAAALTERDFTLLAAGGETLPLADNPGYAEALRAFQELPAATGDVRTERRAPVTVRIYREAESTTICFVNESRWPVDVMLPIESDAELHWRQLGVSPTPSAARAESVNSAGEPARGALARGPQKVELTLAPFGIHARRYSSRHMRVGAFTPQVAAEAAADMARRVAEIEARMAGLNVERAYNELQNPHFELIDENGRLRSWQPRMGARGAVDVAVDEQPIGRSVRLSSEDALGVAVQSHLFAIPATGQIVVRARVRGGELEPGAQLYAWIEYESNGVMRQRYVALGDQSLPKTWTECDFSVDDLPLPASGKMRVQFHLTGSGQVWIDDVRLFDLRFADAQRVELSKRLLGAKAALEEGHLMDCQRLVDSYLPRRLLEHVPPPALAMKSDEASAEPTTDEPEEKGIGPRIRGIVPKILR